MTCNFILKSEKHTKISFNNTLYIRRKKDITEKKNNNTCLYAVSFANFYDKIIVTNTILSIYKLKKERK